LAGDYIGSAMLSVGHRSAALLHDFFGEAVVPKDTKLHALLQQHGHAIWEQLGAASLSALQHVQCWEAMRQLTEHAGNVIEKIVQRHPEHQLLLQGRHPLLVVVLVLALAHLVAWELRCILCATLVVLRRLVWAMVFILNFPFLCCQRCCRVCKRSGNDADPGLSTLVQVLPAAAHTMNVDLEVESTQQAVKQHATDQEAGGMRKQTEADAAAGNPSSPKAGDRSVVVLIPSPSRASPRSAPAKRSSPTLVLDAPIPEENQDKAKLAEPVEAEVLLQENWVTGFSESVIFEEENDEKEYHRKRSAALACFVEAYLLQRTKTEELQGAGSILVEELERLQIENRQVAGDLAYWKELKVAEAEVIDQQGDAALTGSTEAESVSEQGDAVKPGYTEAESDSEQGDAAQPGSTEAKSVCEQGDVAQTKSTEAVRIYGGFTEHTYRLVFPFEDKFAPDAPQLLTIVPSGVVENNKKLEPKKEKGLIAYAYPQSISDEFAELPVEQQTSCNVDSSIAVDGHETLRDTAFVWRREDSTNALVQTWPTTLNEKFCQDFEMSKGVNPDSAKFLPQAVSELREAMVRLFGLSATSCPILFCHKQLASTSPAVVGSGEEVLAHLKEHPELMRQLAIASIDSDGLGFVADGTNGKGEKFEKCFRLTSGEHCVVYRKTGWDTMGCIKPLHQFLRDAEFHEPAAERNVAVDAVEA